jgi:exopolysaccharide biosynthesis polyprenyl glycosylphosphotransferase
MTVNQIALRPYWGATYGDHMATVAEFVTAAPVRRHRGLAVSERKLLLAAGDGLAVAAALVLAFNLHSSEVQQIGFAVPRVAVGITVLAWFAAAYLVDAYRLSAAVNLRATFTNIGAALGIAFVGLLGVFFLVPYRITRPTLLIWLPVTAALVLAWRLAYRRVFADAIFAGSVLVVGKLSGFRRVWPDAEKSMRGLYRVVEVIDPSRPESTALISEMVSEGLVDEIMLGFRGRVSRDLFRCLLSCYDHGVRVRSLADLYEELTGRMLLDQLGHAWLMSLPMRSETSRPYAAFKRVVDLAAGAAGLLLLGLVLPPAALAIKLEDGGPVFYQQERMGKYGRRFAIYKLRTMSPTGEQEQRQTAAGDARVTRTGRVLRNLHLDELPQAWNIVRGDMSIVGPRPEQPAYVAMLQKSIDFYNTRLSVRPGLTGWAQVSAGYSDGVEGAREKLSYDLYYIKRQSPGLDLLILARTLIAVLSLKGR